MRKDCVPLGDLRASGSAPPPGPEKDSWVIVRDTHRVLDKLFPKFLKGNVF